MEQSSLKALTPAQRTFLDSFFGSSLGERFYLTGGTALSAFYLDHRDSFDLDLFTNDDDAPADAARWVVGLRDAGRLSITSHFATGKGFHNFRLVLEGDRLRIDFCHDPSPQLPKTIRGSIRVDGLLDILANKLGALLDFADPKHAVDLYFAMIERQISLAQVRERVAAKRPIEPYRLARALSDAALTAPSGLRFRRAFDPTAYANFLASLRDTVLAELKPP